MKPKRKRGKAPTAEPRPFQLDRWRSVLAAAALALLTFLAFSNSFSAGFILDNEPLLLQDPRFRELTGENIRLILQHTYWWPTGEAGLYRPFTMLSYLFNCAVLGNADAPGRYHCINFLLHLGNVWLVYALARRLLREFWLSFFAAALWAVHPVLTESVTNIIGRSDLFCAVAVLSGFLMYLKSADRVPQMATLLILEPILEADFLDCSYGFRPGRSAHQALAEIRGHLHAGYQAVYDADLKGYFDRVSHVKLMAKIAERVSDKRLLKLIRAFLTAGVMEDGLVSPVDEGTPQGGPLSPLLSNIVLDEFDRELERRGLRFARYADDCNVYVRSRRAGERVMESLKRFLTTKLKLKVNEQKSAVARPWERKFLGFSFTWHREPKRRIAPKAVRRCKEKVRELTRRTRGVSTQRMAKELTRYLRGWLGYFGKCETPFVLEELERWLRRRLRSAIWKQWKRGPVRFAELRQRGVGKDLAAQTAGSAQGPWRLANSPALAIALPNAYFDSLGLPRLTVAR